MFKHALICPSALAEDARQNTMGRVRAKTSSVASTAHKTNHNGRPSSLSDATLRIMLQYEIDHPNAHWTEVHRFWNKHKITEPVTVVSRWYRNRVYRRTEECKKKMPEYAHRQQVKRKENRSTKKDPCNTHPATGKELGLSMGTTGTDFLFLSTSKPDHSFLDDSNSGLHNIVPPPPPPLDFKNITADGVFQSEEKIDELPDLDELDRYIMSL